LGFIASRWIARFKLPSVTAYILLGILIGPAVLNLVADPILKSSEFISNLVLGLIAFSIGQNFSRENFKRVGKSVLWISVLEAGFAWIVVTLTFWLLLRLPFYLALTFGGLSAATDPIATLMVTREYKTRGVFTDTLLGIVAIDDAWCLIIIAISLALAKAITIHAEQAFFIVKVLGKSLLEIFGALIFGSSIAWISFKFSKYLRTQSELLIYTLGFIFLTIGLAIPLHLSVLLSCMALGTVLVNLHRENAKFFETVRAIDPPLYVIFFVTAGAHFDPSYLGKLSILGIAYLIFRISGKSLGAFLGGIISRAPANVRKYIGLALAPQAGVALAGALLAKSSLPQYGGLIFSTIIATTIVYELTGPVVTKYALKLAGELPQEEVKEEV
jgi:Kef-type K+ transport system membrane component KefB